MNSLSSPSSLDISLHTLLQTLPLALSPQNFVLILNSVFILLLPLKMLVIDHAVMCLCKHGHSTRRAHGFSEEAAEAQLSQPSLLRQTAQELETMCPNPDVPQKCEGCT